LIRFTFRVSCENAVSFLVLYILESFVIKNCCVFPYTCMAVFRHEFVFVFLFFGFCMFIVKVQYLIFSYSLAIFVDKGILNM